MWDGPRCPEVPENARKGGIAPLGQSDAVPCPAAVRHRLPSPA